MFRALAVHLHGTTSLETSTFMIPNAFLEKLGCYPKQFHGVSMDNLAINENVLEKNIFIYDIDIENTVKLLRYNNHNIYVKNNDNFFNCFRCPTCDYFSNLPQTYNKHLLRCKDQIKNFYPKVVFTLYERSCFHQVNGIF